jgi:hypothetical protein
MYLAAASSLAAFRSLMPSLLRLPRTVGALTCGSIRRHRSPPSFFSLPGHRCPSTSTTPCLQLASQPATTARMGTGENREQANDPTPPKEPPNVSKTNEIGVTAFGAHDGVLQESAQEGERQRQLQAPNRSKIWSRSQQPRERAMTGPRFEQTIIEHQVSQKAP